MIFYLKCWVPSLSSYASISEITIEQLSILSKYIINQDNSGINDNFNNIIKNNLEDKNIFKLLSKYDKWFIAVFLRAVSISPIINIQTKTLSGVSCTAEYDIIKILSRLSEIPVLKIPKLETNGLKFYFKQVLNLYDDSYPFNYIEKIEYNNTLLDLNTIKLDIEKYNNISILIKNHLFYSEHIYNNLFLLENKSVNMPISPIPFRLTDNTLFAFLKSIYLPYCKVLYNKIYALIKKIGFSYNDLKNLTLLEGQIYLNSYYEEENKKLQKVNK